MDHVHTCNSSTTYLKSVEKGKKEVSNFSRFVDESGPKAFSKNL